MRQLFITGMMRSGTSLAQTILDNHPQLFVAPQPFYQLYLDIKQLFLDEHNLHSLLPLGDGMDAGNSERNLFNKWLHVRNFNEPETAWLIERSITGKSGGACAAGGKLSAKPGTFFSIRNELHTSLSKHLCSQTPAYIGSKDAFCEEYVPELINNNVHCLLIIRDPRAVIASACHGIYFKSVGDRYPLLMLIRLWRKSAAYWLALRNSPLAQAVRYEDIVAKPENIMCDITKWLDIQAFPDFMKDQPLRDFGGNIWKGNSSFGNKVGVESSTKDTWRTLLTTDEIRFIEACTKPELTALGYSYNNDLKQSDISSFTEDVSGVRETYLPTYMLNENNREMELQRWKSAEIGQYYNQEEKRFFLFPEVFRDSLLAI